MLIFLDKIINEFRLILGEENVVPGQDMSRVTSFRTGGPADIFLTPATTAEIRECIALCRRYELGCTVIGNATNLLVRDGGISGAVIKLSSRFNGYRIGGNTVVAQSGALIIGISNAAAQASLSGLEFASGIPGSVGGAVCMNAGAYGGEIRDVLKRITVLDNDLNIRELSCEQAELGYRTSIISRTGWVVLEAEFELKPGDKAAILAQMQELSERRRQKQPLTLPSAGSAFKRPVGYFAGDLIERSGLKGYRIGDAQVSEKHAGFIVNVGSATSSDVLSLIGHIRSTVLARFGVELEPEIRVIGRDLNT